MTTMQHVKIRFPLEIDEDGYPPESVETLWALDIGGGRYKIDNIPFYAKLISDGDIVSASTDDGGLVFEKLLVASSNCTFRVIMLDGTDGFDEREYLKTMGCETEGSGIEGFFAVSVDKAEYQNIASYLASAHNDGKLDFEESSIRG